MHEIKTHGPVQMVFKVFEDFFMYKSGIYTKHPLARVVDSLNPYHSVKVLGWGSEIISGKKINYWVCQILDKMSKMLKNKDFFYLLDCS